jgi:uncharacterized protein
LCATPLFTVAVCLPCKGARISWKQAQRKKPWDPENPTHTFYFDIDENTVIDGAVNGNSARFVNHSCGPNCNAEEIASRGKARIFIVARKTIKPGAELFYDYALTTGTALTSKLKREYKCLCGSRTCRGTMLKAP